MNNKNVKLLYDYVKGIRFSSGTPSLDVNKLDEPYQELGRELAHLHLAVNELNEYKQKEQQLKEDKQRLRWGSISLLGPDCAMCC